MSNNQQAFLALVKAGLWEKEVQLASFGQIDFNEVYRLAEAQAVVGLVAAGIEHVVDVKLPQEVVLQFVGQTLQIEQRNTAMNNFIGVIVGKMRDAGIYTVLVKGQGVAQCYMRPQWRSSGDVDFLLSKDNYEKAMHYLLPMSSSNKADEHYSKHRGMSIDQWYVEVHGSLRTGLTGRIDRVVDTVQERVFNNGNVRSWQNDRTQVFLPAATEDVFFVFTHFVKHLYKEGMNLRQICDWCMLQWKYRDTIDTRTLENWIHRAGLKIEWNTFAALAVEYLGTPKETIPMYDDTSRDRGTKLLINILKGGSGSVFSDTYALFKLFPGHTLMFSPAIFFNVNVLKIKERVFHNAKVKQ